MGSLRVNLSVLALFALWVGAAAARETEVTFDGVGGVTIAGTLTVPDGGDGGAKFPALLLIAGSGPTDRDGNQPPGLKTDLLKQIAQRLADSGIATLRFDKRGMYANIKDLPKDRSQFGDFFAWENFVGDAEAGVRFLSRQAQIDPAHVGILGHSEGGLLAMEVARSIKSAGAPPAAVILLSTPGRPMEVILDEQLKRLLKLQGASQEQRDSLLADNARICREILDKGTIPPDVPAGLAALYPKYLARFLHSDLAVDPAQLATDLTGPVLVMSGAADVQVSSERDARTLDSALSKRRSGVHTLIIVPQASHNLKIVASTTDPRVRGTDVS